MLSDADLSAVRQIVDRGGNAALITQTVTTTYAMTSADRVIRADATAGTFTVTLPTALSVVGALLILVKVDTGANAVTIAVQSPDTIGPSALTSLSLATAGQVVILRAWRNGNSVNWENIHALIGPLTGNADTATKLVTARTLAITGDLAWTSPSFDGSANVTAAGTLATVNVGSGGVGSSTAIPVLTTNAKGLVTAQTTAAVIAPAGTLSGATLNGTVTASSLTSVGTLTGLTVAGVVSQSNSLAAGTYGVSIVGVASAARDLLLAGQSGFSNGLTVQYNGSVMVYTMNNGSLSLPAGSVTATGFTGPLAGNATSATTAGTVTTAAQPAITSVGTLTSLTVSGASSLAWAPTPLRLTADNTAIAAATPTTGVAVTTLQQAVNVNEEWDIEWILHVANSIATDVFVVNVAPTAGTFTGRVKVMGQNGVPTAGAAVAKQLDGPAGTITTATANAPGNTGTIGLVTTIIVRTQGKQTVSNGTLTVQLRAGTSAAVSSGTATVKTQSQMIATRLA